MWIPRGQIKTWRWQEKVPNDCDCLLADIMHMFRVVMLVGGVEGTSRKMGEEQEGDEMQGLFTPGNRVLIGVSGYTSYRSNRSERTFCCAQGFQTTRHGCLRNHCEPRYLVRQKRVAKKEIPEK